MTTQPLLRALPLFPLGTVLFPDGLLPLRIFEVRYLDMIGRCHRNGAPFGVVSLTQGQEVRRPGAEAESFAEVGTLAVIREFDAPQAGLMQIECVGTQRFRLRSSELQKHGLWTAEVDAVPDDVPLALPDDLQHTADALRRLVDTLDERRRMEGGDGVRLPIGEPYRFEDCGWVANRWCELLPMKTELKQRLMALDSPLMRLELVSDLLARAGISK
ncbi:LON peptidase substrate-binding domain-containing protein [Variovorax ginsengisoli]|uniref:LON peptidase substrate-binding domain-containing protein n=1 Tax=Variovorax ginsengisoli TaxID=363844 RepID=A0ABT8RYA7_9BURK|nr:LON peptidase substrate-binding domain-containing protein [Variovorax ginsengisoli]MDN8612489.1 LON peptidase substrate-binding domain-containing protein [Variovorax ginsengisoli]MDO1531659.1 LON peptidase substrate-binding domain-containing protein [Variovorax ginsengisoli]